MKIPIVALGTRGDVQPINEPRRTDREDFGEPRVAHLIVDCAPASEPCLVCQRRNTVWAA